ncbi:MAG: peptidoglycan DD-metalloendopeptidase family protein [Ignavibacteriae bacterium]|nr:peptidoglycan DD-metalloendopeptidase family protein [Ignavibacteriota bacterium]
MKFFKKVKIFNTALYFLNIILSFSCTDIEENNPPQNFIETNIEFDKFGFPIDSFYVVKGEVKRNQILADILHPNNVSLERINEIYARAKSYFDFKKIRPGNKYRFYLNQDSVTSLNSFVYEINPIEFLIINLQDSISMNYVKRETEIVEKTISGVVNYSLYQTFSDLNLSPMLAIKLAEIFAWQIDFYTIQKDDSFFIVYEEEKLGDEVIDIREIKAAKFIHNGKEFNAFLYNNDGKDEYFDEKGKSLVRAFLKAPLKFNRISSNFSRNRLHPILRVYKPHLGIDYAAAVGTPVQAIGDGVILEARYNGAAGNYVKINHNNSYASGYMHLSKYGKGIKKGARVKQGQVIGYVGSTGRSTGPHLDFRFWKNGVLVNYLTQKFISSTSILEENFAYFEILKDSLNAKIERIKEINTNSILAHEPKKNL